MSAATPKKTVLIVDDEKNTREGLARALRREYTTLTAASGRKALELMDAHQVDIMLSDVRMPGMDGLTLLQRTLARTPQPICILLTAYGSIELAVEAMKRGAYDFLTKPVHLDRLELLLKRAQENRQLAEENRTLHEQLDRQYGMEGTVGKSTAMNEVFDIIRQAAPARATVLIQGESGTGKELAAHALHHLSPRKDGPFVAVHCASLSPSLLESELFGHEKGSFTGAEERRAGRFERADGGTLFLDEIGEIDARLQVKILRVLEERRFERVGGQESIDVDVRLLAATNRDLSAMVKEGTFREDLYYRLNVIVISLPPLRDRVGDVPLLLHHFAEQFAEENGRKLQGFTPDALDVLCAYEWPGNVRELRNVVERMVVMSKGDRLGVRDVPAEVRGRPVLDHQASGPVPTRLVDSEKQMIEQALERHAGNRTRAAEELGISRRTLHRKLNEYGLR